MELPCHLLVFFSGPCEEDTEVDVTTVDPVSAFLSRFVLQKLAIIQTF